MQGRVVRRQEALSLLAAWETGPVGSISQRKGGVTRAYSLPGLIRLCEQLSTNFRQPQGHPRLVGSSVATPFRIAKTRTL
jgi:Flp pilus assembly CpaF family ATPase